jgi:hypothetical protein
MIYISHRGNITGRVVNLENHPDYIDSAIKDGYCVEIDVWYNGEWWLGHDEPQYPISSDWILERWEHLWVHCKNVDSIIEFDSDSKRYKDINYFWHENDTLTLTSYSYIWAYPGKQPILNSIAVMPEINNDNVSKCVGICSDYIKRYKDEIEQTK